MGKLSESSISLDSKQFVHDLISALQHEIRNDITNIQSNSYFLFRKIHKPTIEAEEYMQRITTKSDKILRQVSEMSDLFQIHNKTFKLDIESFNIIPFLKDTVEVMKKLCPKKPITLTTPGNHSIMIEGDKKRIEMLLKRIISHTNEYSAPACITGLELSQKDHQIEITIWPYLENKKEHNMKPSPEPKSEKKFNLLSIELALYEEIIKKHKGTFKFVRTVAGDQAFFIMLPIGVLLS